MRIEVPFVMLFWYYGLTAADTSQPEGHHASPNAPSFYQCLTLVEGYYNGGPAVGPHWDLLAKFLDPIGNMDVYAALLARQRILTLALTPTKELDEEFEQDFCSDQSNPIPCREEVAASHAQDVSIAREDGHILVGEIYDVNHSSDGAGESDGGHELESLDVQEITERVQALPDKFLAKTMDNFPSLQVQ